MKNGKLLLIIFFMKLLYGIELPNEFSAKFIQTIKSNDQNLTYKGQVFYKKGNIVWKYNYPTQKIIWIEDKVYIYEPDLLQVTITKRKKLTLEDILKNSKKIKNNLYISQIDNKKIYFIYDKTLKKLYYTDDIGNKVEINFFEQNKKTPKEIFKINYPQDIDIIYQ
ncbi:hypothetical protein JCM11957_04040 [Caminibacter profundus]